MKSMIVPSRCQLLQRSVVAFQADTMQKRDKLALCERDDLGQSTSPCLQRLPNDPREKWSAAWRH